MEFLQKFLQKYNFFVFFVILEIAALSLIFSRNVMQQSFLAAQTGAFNAWVNGYINKGVDYLRLKQENADLAAQNKALMEQLYGKDFRKAQYVRVSDTAGGGQVYTIVDADVVNNSIIRKNNYFTINRGTRYGVLKNMGVIAPQGVAGIVINTTDNYAIVRSALSVNNIKINASLKNSGYFGTLTWDGEDPRTMRLSDIPKYVTLRVGDTVVTDEKSAIFPADIMIGRIAGYEVDTKTGFWNIDVELSQNMGNLQKVFVVRNLKHLELQQIQDTLNQVLKNEK